MQRLLFINPPFLLSRPFLLDLLLFLLFLCLFFSSSTSASSFSSSASSPSRTPSLSPPLPLLPLFLFLDLGLLFLFFFFFSIFFSLPPPLPLLRPRPPPPLPFFLPLLLFELFLYLLFLLFCFKSFWFWASIGGRAITNLRFAEDINGLAGEEGRTGKISWASRQSLHSLRHGDQCREDQADDKQHQWHQHKDQNKWTEAWDYHSLQVPGLSCNWRGFRGWDTLQHSTDNNSIDKVEEEYKPWKWGATARHYASHTKTMLPTRKFVP